MLKKERGGGNHLCQKKKKLNKKERGTMTMNEKKHCLAL